ncbi:DUF262 domain-containing protein [Campylobacter helveticus]|uniref:DUF262 domain-containing protein n=1 Tax=Campylobacter helveticus TaxID=28898 RepID=UPI0022EB172B|nr:DUF262 domain-containing protein [Campylobacter helveticus]
MTNLKILLRDNKVEIPMLQRDYAQGRMSQNKIANEFLDSIFSVLNGKKQSLHIDFIYGYKEDGKFLLIDGQQRITTLWLLHFYLYKIANSLEEIKGLLKNFSYNTRNSSVKFCKNLLKKDFDINHKPSEAIKAKGGEFEKAENLNNDPTIKAMLHMLDLIFERVKNKKDLNRLIENLDKITFNLFDMGEFGLGEELYIKMNARGKQLSKYENLKSFIEKDSKISKDSELLGSIDTNWSDYFFDGKKPESFDKKGCNFLHYATLFFMLQNKEKIKDIKEIIDNPNQPINEFYIPLQDIDNIRLLDRVVSLCKLFDKLQITEFLKIKDSSFFVSRNKETLSYLDICYFFSVLFFVKENRNIEKVDKNALNDYLRVCRHFIENHSLDKEEHISGFFKLFNHLSQGYSDIYQFLADNPNPQFDFHSSIYRLEARKAKLILGSRQNGEKWEEILSRTSKHRVLNGWIDFILDFSDETFEDKQYNQNKKILEKPNFKKFEQYANLTMELLNKSFLDKHIALFQRAFLCIGNFSFYSINWFYGNSPTDIFRDREALNWILKGNKNDLKYPYFKKFLDTLLEIEGEDLADKMQNIINKIGLTQKEWWEQLLIGEPKMFDFINKKEIFQRYRRIRFFDKELNPIGNNLKDVVKVELLPGLRNTTNVRDLLDYGFYCYCKRKELLLSPYECKEKQYGTMFEPYSHFSLNGVKVLCNSQKSKIYLDNKEYLIQLQRRSSIFDEFDKILGLIEIDGAET